MKIAEKQQNDIIIKRDKGLTASVGKLSKSAIMVLMILIIAMLTSCFPPGPGQGHRGGHHEGHDHMERHGHDEHHN